MIPSLNRHRQSSAVLFMILGACSSQEKNANSRDSGIDQSATNSPTQAGALADTLTTVCPAGAGRGSILVARVAPEVEEGGIAFKLLGDGAGPGVVLCRDVLYADVTALSELMGDSVAVNEHQGQLLIGARPTQIQAYRHDGVFYAAVAPFARHRRALLMPSADHPMDATIWPRATLLHLKASGNTRGSVYQAAVREGLLPE